MYNCFGRIFLGIQTIYLNVKWLFLIMRFKLIYLNSSSWYNTLLRIDWSCIDWSLIMFIIIIIIIIIIYLFVFSSYRCDVELLSFMHAKHLTQLTTRVFRSLRIAYIQIARKWCEMNAILSHINHIFVRFDVYEHITSYMKVCWGANKSVTKNIKEDFIWSSLLIWTTKGCPILKHIHVCFHGLFQYG